MKNLEMESAPSPSESSKPLLDGIKVIELAGLAPVPFCGLLLADFGATVTLVINKSASIAEFDQRLIRGKQKIVLDFKCQIGLEKLRKLCNSADVLLDPYRPGTLENIGLDPEKLLEENPGLVIARITGFGQNGRLAKKAGHDINFVALSGLLPSISGKRNGSVSFWPPANLLADFAGGSLLSAFGVVSALLKRAKNGKGCILDCSMTEGVAYLGSFINFYRDQSWMWDEEFAIFSGNCPIYRTYETKDGKWIAVGALEKKFQQNLFQTLNLQEIPMNLKKLTKMMEKIFKSKKQEEWIEIFKDKDACVTPVLDIDRQLGQFEHHRARGAFKIDEGTGIWVPRAAPIVMEIGKKNEKSKL